MPNTCLANPCTPHTPGADPTPAPPIGLRPAAVLLAALLLGLVLGSATPVAASSHREAPLITEMPKVDATDFYMFRSYEPGRQDFVTLVADYIPLQDPFGGPNYFSPDPEARYRIHIDNDGDGVENLTFEFDFLLGLRDLKLPVGDKEISIPLIKAGSGPFALENTFEVYRLTLLRGEIGAGAVRRPVDNPRAGSRFFTKPVDRVGAKAFPDYEAYARRFIFDVDLPGCGPGRVFVGQRKDPFVVNLGEVFDLVSLDPLGPPDGETDDLADKNVTTFALEVPIACLTEGRGDVIGGWTTAALPRTRRLESDPGFSQPEATSGDRVQVSRLGMPLVNEVVIGLKDKNRFNASRPDGDAQFADYVTHPTLPAILELLFGVGAPRNLPRADLVAVFVTGVPGLNELGFGEMQRLNTAIPPVPASAQSRLGLLGGDNAGFPNGRRPGDDVVDIALRTVMGAVCHAFPGAFCAPEDAPAGLLPFTDGAFLDAGFFDERFPYLKAPLPGSPR